VATDTRDRPLEIESDKIFVGDRTYFNAIFPDWKMVIPCTIAITTDPLDVFVSFLIPARKSKLEVDGTR